MRIFDLTQTVAEATEVLQTAAAARSAYQQSCRLITPEEVCAHMSALNRLSRLASTLAELAADELAEDV